MHLSGKLSGLIYGNSFAVALLPRKNKICWQFCNYFLKSTKTSPHMPICENILHMDYESSLFRLTVYREKGAHVCMGMC